MQPLALPEILKEQTVVDTPERVGKVIAAATEITDRLLNGRSAMTRDMDDQTSVILPRGYQPIRRRPDGDCDISGGQGLLHIVTRHAGDFVKAGVTVEDIPDLILEAAVQKTRNGRTPRIMYRGRGVKVNVKLQQPQNRSIATAYPER